MARDSANALADRHLVLPDIGKAKQAKADVRTPDMAPETPEWMVLIGAAIQRAVSRVGWSNKEAAAKVGVDDAEFGKWLSGNRRPQFDRLMALDALRWPLICALAELMDTAEEVTTLRKKVG
jgi:ribosome-binding protein aMBF1 (putative translation factor)